MNKSKIFNKDNLLKLLIDSGLIIFSVLFALFINEYRNSIHDDKLKYIALLNVKNELQSNLEVVNDWLPYHKEVLKNFQSAIENDSINQSVKTKEGIDFRKIMPRGVVQSLINNTSWETLKNSSVVSNLEYESLLKLSKIYEIQNKGVQKTLDVIIEILSSREALRIESSDETLILLRNAFAELVSQEETLIQYYEVTLEEL